MTDLFPENPEQEATKRPATLNGLNGPGRPSKRTAQLETQLVEAIEAGATFKLACELVSITEVVFCLWRREDPDFAARVDAASAKGDLARIKTIDGYGAQDWGAPAWLLERRRPMEYGRQTAAAINVSANAAAVANGNGNGQSFQSVVVSDLEFLALRDHPDYEHTPAGPVLEVRAEIVPEELSGSLSRQGYSGTVVSQSAADARAKRYAEIRAKTIKLVEARDVAQQAAGSAAGELPEHMPPEQTS